MSSESPPVSPRVSTPEPESPAELAKSPSPHSESMETLDVVIEPEEVVKEDQTCQVCAGKFRQPRVLSCLHVFCTPCLEQQLKGDPLGELEDEGLEEEGKEEEPKEESDKPVEKPQEKEVVEKTLPESIQCPICQQETPLSAKGVVDLPQDLVMVNMLDLAAIKDMQIVCTSCKSREKAVARCADCVNFLCPNCVMAHQFMRCFENHKVVSFDELKNGQGIALHKPVFCDGHPAEAVKFYCNTCQEVMCGDCTDGHKSHQVNRISDIEENKTEELKALMKENQSKTSFCKELASKLENSQQELQMQREDCRSLIQETFQTYKAILDRKQEELLQQLSTLHSEKRSNLWELTHHVEKTIERIEDGCLFVDRVVKNGSGSEVLAMSKLISTQLLSLINNTPKPDIQVKMEFVTDEEKFKQAVDATFGRIVTDEDEQKLLEEQQAQQLETLPSALNVNLTEELAGLHLAGIHEEDFSLPPGMLASPDGIIPTVSTTDLLQNIGLPPLSIPNIPPLPGSVTGVVAETISNMATSLPNLSSDKSSSRNSYSPAMSDSGISVDAGSTGSNPQPPLINLTTLSKQGSININSQGQITLNGQVIPGLNVNNMTGLPHAITNRVGTSTPTSEAALTSLLNSLSNPGVSSSGSSVRSQTPQLATQMTDITGLLNQANQQLNGLSGLTGGPGMIGSTGSLIAGSRPNSGGAALLTQPLPPLSTGHAIPMNLHTDLHTPPPLTPTYTGGQPSHFARTSSGKMGAMQIRCKFGQLGPGKGQFNSPHGFCLGLDEDIVVADTNNHRIQVFEKTGEFKYQFGIPGREEGQLWYPRKVAVSRTTGKYVVCDRGNERSRMQIFTKNGHFVKKIAIRYIDIVAGLAITAAGHIVAVDSVSPTVFCIAETGDLIKWFDCSDYMREPSDIAISGKEYFVCDFKGHCVVVFDEDGQFVRRIGCENITNFPNGIDVSDAGDVLVGDSHGNRFHVAVFHREGSLIGEFECPYVKVSRCCGLKITSEGYIVTLAKNNHHVLVLNTLYIT